MLTGVLDTQFGGSQQHTLNTAVLASSVFWWLAIPLARAMSCCAVTAVRPICQPGMLEDTHNRLSGHWISLEVFHSAQHGVLVQMLELYVRGISVRGLADPRHWCASHFISSAPSAAPATQTRACFPHVGDCCMHRPRS